MLINKKFLSAYSPLPVNYNFEEIMLYQPIAIKIWLEPIIGPDFLESLEYMVENNQVSEEASTLFTEGGLYQYLAYAMCYEGLPFIFAHFSEVGITLPDTENSKSVDLKQLNYIQDHLRRTLDYLKDALIKWLCEHQESFPIFDPSGVCPCCNSCCGEKGLNNPNPDWKIYSTKKLCTELL